MSTLVTELSSVLQKPQQTACFPQYLQTFENSVSALYD